MIGRGRVRQKEVVVGKCLVNYDSCLGSERELFGQ